MTLEGNVDAITTFSFGDIEKPIIRAFSSIGNVMTMAPSSATNDKNLKVVAEDIRDDLLDNLPEVSQVNIEFIRRYRDFYRSLRVLPSDSMA